MSDVTIRAADGGSFSGYLATPKGGKGPGILVIQEIFGVNKVMRDIADGFAAQGFTDLQVTLAYLRSQAACTGKVGTVGFCLGGKLAYLMATRSDAECNVGYYGVGIERALDEAGRITRPLMLHIAEKDQFCPPEAQSAIKSVLGKHPKVTIHSYPGADHAFARIGGQHYDKAAATSANQRTADFFKQHLGA